jgi:type IV secretion system protein VirB6
MSKTMLQKPMSISRQGLGGSSSLLEKGRRMGAASQNLWKQLHKNLRKGGS